jgi:hypothetical protein
MTRRGVIASHLSLFVIASLQPHTVIASERSEQSNLLETLNTKRNVQWGDCFTPTHLPTLAVRNEIVECWGDCFVASLLAMTGRKRLSMTGREEPAIKK